jgi:hypothetical protein
LVIIITVDSNPFSVLVLEIGKERKDRRTNAKQFRFVDVKIATERSEKRIE